jgi:hypothetical protein
MKLIFGMQPYSNPPRRNMEDDLNILENGRRPTFFEKRKTTLFFFKWNTTGKKCNQNQMKVKTIIC